MRSTIRDERVHVVHGRIGSTGAIISGSGDFTSIRNSAGYFTIRLNSPFRGSPTVNASVEVTAPGAAAYVDVIDGRSFNVRIGSIPGNALGDVGFDFIACGIVA